eukprot:Skav216439  [mRNA]  locus=scaffold2689:38255:38680:+ [translate_table: standard]
MPPKRNHKEVKKIALKNGSKSASISLADGTEILKLAVEAESSSSVSFNKILNNCSLDALNSIEDYLAHGKTTIPKKIEAFGEFTSEVSRMVQLRDYLDVQIQKASDLIHDEIIKVCGGDQFDIEILKSKVSKQIGRVSMTD